MSRDSRFWEAGNPSGQLTTLLKETFTLKRFGALISLQTWLNEDTEACRFGNAPKFLSRVHITRVFVACSRVRCGFTVSAVLGGGTYPVTLPRPREAGPPGPYVLR